MSSHALNIVLEDDRWLKLCDQKFADFVFETTLSFLEEKALGRQIDFSKSVCVNLSLSNDAEIQQLNLSFRGMDKPTNVLSFANIDDVNFESEAALQDEIEMGDIMIALETLEREAEQKNIAFQSHFAHLFVHGLLHLFGYDHQEDDEAEEMEGIEVEILAEMGISNPYGD